MCTQLHLYSYVTHLIGEEKTIARVKPPGWFKAASLAAFFLCSLNGLHGKLVLSYRQNFWIQGCPGEVHVLYHPHSWENSPGDVICRKWVMWENLERNSFLANFQDLMSFSTKAQFSFPSSLRHHHFLSQLSSSGHPVITKTWHFLL